MGPRPLPRAVALRRRRRVAAVPTEFASTIRAREMLAEDLRSRVEGLTAVHLTGTKMRGGDDPDLLLSTFAADHSAAAPRMRVRAGTIS